jgi:hypothetical protein
LPDDRAWPGKDPPSVRSRVHRSAQNRLGRSADRPRLGVGGRKKTAAPTKPQQLDRSRREPDIRGVSIGCTSASPVCIVTNPHAHCRPAGSRDATALANLPLRITVLVLLPSRAAPGTADTHPGTAAMPHHHLLFITGSLPPSKPAYGLKTRRISTVFLMLKHAR